jgi:hypothetical protein
MKLAAVMIVTGCRCDLVWHCGCKGNGDGKANHGNDERPPRVKSATILFSPYAAFDKTTKKRVLPKCTIRA